MTCEEIRLLYEYDAWANQRMRDAAAVLTPEQFLRDLGSSFPSVRDTMAHIYGATWIWLERWKGNTPGTLPTAADFPTHASVVARWGALERELIAFVRTLSAADLASEREYRTLKGTAFRNPLWQSLQHLVNHNSYHRGQLTTMLRQLGATPVSTDLILFYRDRGVAA